MKTIVVGLTAFVAALVTVLVISFLFSWPIMVLWNECLIPAVNGLNEIGWVQAWGISTLFAVLFKTNIK
jgi:hypothetical protein